MAQEPELKNLTLEGVSLTLKDVNLTLPQQERDEVRIAKHEASTRSVEQSLAEIQLAISNLTEVANCVASQPDAQIIQNTLLGKASSLEQLAQSCLKSAPKILFRHEGKVTHHIGSVGGKYIIARSG